MPEHSTTSLLQQAVALHQQGKLDAALTLYREVLALDARQSDALHLSGVIARQQGDAHGAVRLIEQALAIDPAQARPHCNLGAAYADLGESARALACYDAAIALDPRYALAHSNRGNALRQLGRLEQAVASYDTALRLNPASFDAACQRAIALHDQGRHAAALDGAEQALRLRPQHAPAWAARGNALYGLGHWLEAADSFEHALALGGARADVLGWRGGALFKMGRFDDALASFDASLSLRPGHAGTALRRAHALDALQLREEAARAYRHALALGADAGEVGFALAALGQTPAPAAAPASYVSALFDQYAGHFDEHLVQQLGYRTPELIGAALARCGGGTELACVDLGCGTGLCGPVLRPLCASLVGVDLSAGMLERARARALYDELVGSEIGEFLRGQHGAFDLIVAADVFVYVGELAALFALARQALRAGGRFCFSVESPAQGDVVLQPSRRYAHGEGYLRALAALHGFEVLEAAPATLRSDRGDDVAGMVFVLIMRDLA